MAWLIRALLILAPGTVLAGRPLNTEDATTLAGKACQVETWADHTREGVTDFYFVPACTLAGVEWQAGGARRRGSGRDATTVQFVQAKHAFRSIDDGDWGIGAVAGMSRFPQREERSGWGDPYLIVPLSLAIGEDKDTRALVHLNAGTMRVRDRRRDLTLWGIAVEKPVNKRLTVLAEAWGENSARPFARVGTRFALLEGLDADFSWVARAGGAKEERYWSLGLHWETKPFLP